MLDLYRLNMGAYPSTEQGLQALVARPSGAAAWNGPYLKAEAGPLLEVLSGLAPLGRSPGEAPLVGSGAVR